MLYTIGRAQFTVIETNTQEPLINIGMHSDTLVVKGALNYFAKSYDLDTLTILSTDLPMDNSYVDLHIIDDVYYLMGQDRMPYSVFVFESHDLGQHWDTVYSRLGLFSHLTVYDSAHMILGGTLGGDLTVRHPIAGWYDYQQYWLGGGFFGTSAYYNADTVFLGKRFNGLSYISYDGGATVWSWNQAGSTNDAHESVFISKDTIYAAGHGSDHIIFHYSYNMGQDFNWIDFNFFDDMNFLDTQMDAMWFENSMHGYLFGSSGLWFDPKMCTIFETHDGGLSWLHYVLEYPGSITSVTQANDSIFFLGCSDGLLLKWNRNEPLYSLGIEEQEADQHFSIFPNPAQKQFNIKHGFELTEKAEIEMYDVSGKLVRQLPFQTTVNIESLESGIYIVALRNNTQLMGRQKLIVE